MRIDLHCHTKKVKQGDPETRNVSVDQFKRKVQDADVRILAITNHNCFDLEQYELLFESVKGFCDVWPGVELDIKNDFDKWHLIVVANPVNAKAFSDGVRTLIGDANPNTCTFAIKAVVNVLDQYDVIYIPHFHKEPAIPEKEREELSNLVGDNCRIINETPNVRTMGVFSNHDYRVIIGSDVQDWSKYDQSDFAVLRLPVSSFTQFLLLAKKDPKIVETILSEKNSRNIQAFPHPKEPITLTLYEEMNIVFGQKGTGKSEILRSMYAILKEQGLDCVYYCGSEKEKGFEKLTNTSNLKRDLSKIKAETCEEDFTSIFEWKEKNPTLISKFLNWGRNKANKGNKAKMKITNATNQATPSPKKFKQVKGDYGTIQTIFDMLEKVHLEIYYSDEEKKNFYEVLNELLVRIKKEKIRRYIEKESIKLSNYSINRIKSIADKNTESPSKPSTTGFYDFAINRLQLQKSTNTIINNIHKPAYVEKDYLGDLEGKGKIYIHTIYRTVSNNDSRRQDFIHKITTLREVHKLLQTINSCCTQSDIANTIATITHLCKEENIKSVYDFLGICRDIVTEKGEVYTPSSGEQGMLLLQKELRNEASAYILDEPELGMGNSYIEQSVRPILSDLAKDHKIVVVATHNANIAVRCMPYMSIYRAHQNGKYYTYIGNPFVDMLVNIHDADDIRNWRDESMHTLEGGEEAFYERQYVYESGNR